MNKSKVPVKVVQELNRQLNQELGAAHSYRALSFWCEDQNFKGFARYFGKQVGEEHVHANKIASHLIDRGLLPEIGAVAAPNRDFKTLLDVALHAQAMEQANTKGVHSVYDAALTERDLPAQVLMHYFISEQIEEEDWCSEMVERVQRASCAGGLSDLDRHIERYLGESLFSEDGKTE